MNGDHSSSAPRPLDLDGSSHTPPPRVSPTPSSGRTGEDQQPAARKTGMVLGTRGGGVPGSPMGSGFPGSPRFSVGPWEHGSDGGRGTGYERSTPTIPFFPSSPTLHGSHFSPPSSPHPSLSHSRRSPPPSSTTSGGYASIGDAVKPAGIPRCSTIFRHPNRLARIIALAAVAGLGLWTLWLQRGDLGEARGKIAATWTAARSAVKLPAVAHPFINPALNPAHPSHSFEQLSSLPSTFSPTSPATWTAIVHLSDSSQLPQLPALLESLLHQSSHPASTFVLAPTEFAHDLGLLNISIAHLPYPHSRPPALALALASTPIPTSLLLVLDADITSLPTSYTTSLLHAAGTFAYSNSLLAHDGLSLSPTGIASCPPTISHSIPIHFPTTPFLLHTSWLKPLLSPSLNALRSPDLPLAFSLALALRTTSAITSFALPLPSLAAKFSNCEDLLETEVLDEGPLLASFFEGEPLAARSETEGAVVLLLAGLDELGLARSLACGLANDKRVRIYVAEVDAEELGRGEGECELEIRFLGDSGGGLERETVVKLAKMGWIDLVIYLADGRAGREFREAMRWSGAVMGRDEERGGIVAIGLSEREVGMAEWISALPIEALRHWHTPRIDISVITNNRPTSLARLLTSLSNAHYFGDDVSLSISLEQTADKETQTLVDALAWPFGVVTLRHRILLGGLMPAIVESWYPASNDSYGVFLEDDIEVSPQSYAWLKLSILYYRYYTPMRSQSARMYGVSLYQPRAIELRLEGRQPFDAHALFANLSLPSTLPYLSQIPCSWGAVYFPEIWREFHAYLGLRLVEPSSSLVRPIVPEIRSNRWTRSWKKHFIDLAYLRGYTMLYPNFANFSSLSTNHVEKGVHISIVVEATTAQFEVPLMRDDESVLDLPGRKMPTWDALPVLDFWGAVASEEELVGRGAKLVVERMECPALEVGGGQRYDVGELLCGGRGGEKVEVDAGLGVGEPTRKVDGHARYRRGRGV